MERAPVPLQSAGRAASSPVYGRASAPTSFDPTASSHAPAGTKIGHAKDYGSSFSDGFLNFLRSGDLSDVVVEVVCDSHDTNAYVNPVPAPTPNPASPGDPDPRFNRTYSTGPWTSNPSTTSTYRDAGIGGQSCQAFAALASVPKPSSSAPGPAQLPSSTSPFGSPDSESLVNPMSTSLAPAGFGEYHLHGLLLARHSAFFAAALGQSHFADSAARRIRLTLDAAAAPAWPALVEYFYTDRIKLDDSNALPLLALARQLLVSELDGYCTDFVCGRLCAANCLTHLRAAVRFALHDLHSECVMLAAQGFPLLYGSDLSGLPPASLLEVLTHPLLQVHCELQVVEAVTRYLATTAVDVEAQRALCAQIRFPYLDNATITRLAVQPSGLMVEATNSGGGDGQEAAGDAADAGTTTTADAGSDAQPGRPVPGGGNGDTLRQSEPTPGANGTERDRGNETAFGGRAAGAAPADTAGVTHGPVSTADGQGTSGAAGGGSSRTADGGGVSAGEAADSGGAAGGGAAVADGAGEADGSGALVAEASSLISVSGSACSSPTSSCGGAAAATMADAVGRLEHPRNHVHLHRPPGRSKADESESQPGTALRQQQQQQQQLAQVAPLLPRDMTLEGALARLAAMEFHASLPSAQQGNSQDPSQHTAHGGGAVPGPGNGAVVQSSYNPYLHPYQQYQFRYQYGTGAAALPGAAAPQAAGQAAAAAAAANGGRRPLAVFPGMGGLQQGPLPPAPPPLGGAGAGGAGRPLAHYVAPPGAQYDAQRGAPPPHNDSVHTALALAYMRGPMPGGTAAAGGEGEGGRAEDVAGRAARSAAVAVAAGPGVMDPAAAFAAACLPPPRLSYCCNVMHGLPGGCAWVDVALEALWEHLVPYITVQVSGCCEGTPRNVVSLDPDHFFETNDSSDPLPWVEVQLPHNVHVLQLHRYTFMHGHRRAGYYRARNFKTQIAVRPASEAARSSPAAGPAGGAAPTSTGGANQGPGGAGVGGAAGAPGAANGAAGAAGQRPGPAAAAQGAAAAGAATAPAAAPSPQIGGRYYDLTTRMAEQFDVMVLAGATAVGPWKVLRIQATGAQEDGVHRLCVRGVRMYGVARVDLMHQADGFVVQPQWILNARVDQGGSSGGAAGVGAGPSYGGSGAAGAGPGGTSVYFGRGGGGLPQWLGWQHAA